MQYFYLSQFWGAVPLVTKTLTLEEANTATKTPKADIINFLITEFSEAAADLPRYKDIPASESVEHQNKLHCISRRVYLLKNVILKHLQFIKKLLIIKTILSILTTEVFFHQE